MKWLILFYIFLYIICIIVLLQFFSNKEKLFDFSRARNGGSDLQEIEKFKERRSAGIINLLFGAFLILFGFLGFGSIGRNLLDLGGFMSNLVVVLLCFLCMILGGKLVIRGRQQTEPSAEITIKYSVLPPILYLRNFDNDQNISYSTRYAYFQGLKYHETLETQFTKALQKIGLLIAIGKPGEKLPLPGASRSYFVDEEWFFKFKEYMSMSKLIIVSIDFTDGISTEINEILHTACRKKTIFYLALRKRPKNKIINIYQESEDEILWSQSKWNQFFSMFAIKKNEKIEAQLREKKIYQFLYFDRENNPNFYIPQYANSDHLHPNHLGKLTKDFRILVNVLEENC